MRLSNAMCPEEDTLDHTKVCPFMYTKWNHKMISDEDIANYLVELTLFVAGSKIYVKWSGGGLFRHPSYVLLENGHYWFKKW